MDIEERAEKWTVTRMAKSDTVLPEWDMVRSLLIEAYLAGSAQAQADYASHMASEGLEPGAPIITDIGAFDRKTAELRAAGFTKEADSRDRYAHPARYRR